MIGKILVVLTLVTCPLVMFAQKGSGDVTQLSGILRDDNKALIRKAIEGAVCLVRSGYNLKNDSSGVVYAKKNKKFFNIKYTVGVVAGGQLMLPPAAQAPWVGDDSLASYGDGFKPLLSAVGVRALSDSTFSAVDITKITTVKNGLVVAAIPDTFRQLSISKASCVEGDYVIWLAVAKNNVADSPLATTLFYNKLTMPVSSTSLPSLVKEPITDNYVAGGIVLETQIAPGNIRFLVKGLLMKTTAGWVVQPVTEKKVTLAGQDELEALPKPGSTVEADAPAIQPNKKSKKQKK